MSSLHESVRIASAWALSLFAHGALIGVGAVLVIVSSLREREAAGGRDAVTMAAPHDDTITIDLPTMVDSSSVSRLLPASSQATPLVRGGGEVAPRPDSGHAGRGGTDAASQAAINLADRDDGIRLSRDVQSRYDRSQIPRIETGAADRASREDWRASRTPMELTFLASGNADGTRAERRPPSDHDPSAGAEVSVAPSQIGAASLGGPELAPGFGERPRQAGGEIIGGEHASPGAGLRDGRPGQDHRDSANVPLARPKVVEGTPSVPANVADKPRDTLDSEQEEAALLQSIVHASTAGGSPGAGPGGQAGPGATGSGGTTGAGSRAKALGTGRGAGTDSSLEDPRRTTYLRQVMAKVHPLWKNAFPRWAAIEGLQGTAIISFVIQSDGSVSNATIARPSGIPEFDENCRQAVLRGAPFPPLPSELGRTLRWSMPFEVRNPAVRPKDVGSAPR
jgi:TonB family protein